jgi:multicomponent Na+:H+ antiporter subunit E
MQHTKKRFSLGKGEIFSAFVLATVWFLLTRGSFLSWSVGIPAIILSLSVKRLLVRQSSFALTPLAFFPFLIFFVQQSLLGGIDVAWRSICPSCRLSPCLITYRFEMSNEIARVFFTNVVSLLPGTLSVDMFSDGVQIHMLDETLSNEANLKRLESKVAALFGERIVYV